jgi:hypothetical protein
VIYFMYIMVMYLWIVFCERYNVYYIYHFCFEKPLHLLYEYRRTDVSGQMPTNFEGQTRTFDEYVCSTICHFFLNFLLFFVKTST